MKSSSHISNLGTYDLVNYAPDHRIEDGYLDNKSSPRDTVVNSNGETPL